MIRRLGYLIAQVQSRKELRENDFEMKFRAAGEPEHSPEVLAARKEAAQIRQEVAAAAKTKRIASRTVEPKQLEHQK